MISFSFTDTNEEFNEDMERIEDTFNRYFRAGSMVIINDVVINNVKSVEFDNSSSHEMNKATGERKSITDIIISQMNGNEINSHISANENLEIQFLDDVVLMRKSKK